MADKRVTQVPLLQLELQYEPHHPEEVKQHWNVTFAHQKRISVYGKRILARVISQIRENDYELRPYYQLRLASIVEEGEGDGADIATAYNKVKGALYELAHVMWEFESPTTKEWYLRHLLDTSKEYRVGYKAGVVTVVLNPQLAPYLVKAAHYSTFPLDGYLRLQSWYSMRLYEILAAYQDTGYWEVALDDYRQYMDCWAERDKRGQYKKDKAGKLLVKYPTTALLLEKTLREPLRELAGTDLEFTYQPIFETSRSAPGRKKIVRLRFDLVKGPRLRHVPEGWLQNGETGPLILRLREWKVSDSNIARYAPALRQDGVRELLKAWEAKNRSNRHIDDKQRYCNAAFVRAGKAALTAQKEADRQQEVADRAAVQQALGL